MKPYVYQKSKKIYILDWGKIIKSCDKVEDYIEKVLGEGKNILFLATKKSAREIVKEQALNCGMPFIKEQVKIQKRHKELYSVYEGVVSCEQRPNALFIIGLEQEKTALKEAKKTGIPVIAVCNTNCNPQLVDYALPGNDEEKTAVNFFAKRTAQNKVVLYHAENSEIKEVYEATKNNSNYRAMFRNCWDTLVMNFSDEEHAPDKGEVGGSIPPSPTKFIIFGVCGGLKFTTLDKQINNQAILQMERAELTQQVPQPDEKENITLQVKDLKKRNIGFESEK
ncbi:17453_t:CDS:2 [Racocetra fulgida]|uniref:17453_t:CDS:1 n=1 Tax=Racocetra fulgida TaxID=60492 RepID=A0A9N8VYG9_9GLOM|nr:17453_t:CDS:2 [Racocetra fulgida]